MHVVVLSHFLHYGIQAGHLLSYKKQPASSHV